MSLKRSLSKRMIHYNNIGLIYPNIFRADIDDKEAFKKYKLYADQGHSDAQNNI